MANLENLFVAHQPVGDKKGRTRAQILQAALTCFADKGYHQTSMDDIVAESGLSKGALYWHFKSKQELFLSLVETYMSAYSQEAAHAWQEEMPATDKIRTYIKFFVDSSEQLLPFFRVTIDFWAQTSEDEQLRAIFDRMLADFQQQLGALIEEGVAAGKFRPVDAPKLALGLVAALDALALYKTLLTDKIDIQGSAETLLAVVIAGLKVEGVDDVA
jgi:AcrR family transcriptional regulator